MSSDQQINRSIDDAEVRDRAIRLFKYLKELTELRTNTIRNLDQYEKVLWFNEIPRRAECQCIAWPGVSTENLAESWIEIKKPKLKQPPIPPKSLTDWLNVEELTDSSLESPPLRERISVQRPVDGTELDTEPETVFMQRSEFPNLEAEWDEYVKDQWVPWAEEDRELQVVQDVYTELFSIYQKQKKLGEAYEVIVGLGFLVWRTQDGHEIRRHIITAQTSLEFDSKSGLISVGPAGQGAKPVLEQDMLDPTDRPRPDRLNVIESEVGELGENLWDGVRAKSPLMAWANEASSKGSFEDGLTPNSTISENPVVSFAPAIILRKRSERSLIQIFQIIIEQLAAATVAVPIGVQRLVTIFDDLNNPTDFGGIDTAGAVETASEIYFPLAANDAQIEIVKRLAVRQGVLVQGPPGTGKSHTISNLICHLLAEGQRVLVTSHTARALSVLKGKIPAQVGALCVNLLGDDLESLQALEDSVRGITEKFNNWDANSNRATVVRIERALNSARAEEARILSELRAIREAETYCHPTRPGGYRGTTQQIACALKAAEQRYAWISQHEIDSRAPIISNQELSELRRLMDGAATATVDEARMRLVSSKILISPQDFAELSKYEQATLGRYENHRTLMSGDRFKSLSTLEDSQLSVLTNGLAQAVQTIETFLRQAPTWAKDAAVDVLAGKERVWRELHDSTQEILSRLGDKPKRAAMRVVSGVPENQKGLLRQSAQALLIHLESGGSLGIAFFKPKVVRSCKQLITEVRVDGLPCTTPQTLRQLLEWMDVTDAVANLRQLWNAFTPEQPGALNTQVAGYSDLRGALSRVLDLRSSISRIAESLPLGGTVSEPSWQDLADIKQLLATAEAAAITRQLTALRTPLLNLSAQLTRLSNDSDVHPSTQSLLDAIERRSVPGYTSVFHSIEHIEAKKTALKKKTELLSRLRAVSPTLLSEFVASFNESKWTDFEGAIQWEQCDAWLKKVSDPSAGRQLGAALTDSRKQISDLIRNLSAEKAWEHCFEADRLTEPVRQHLMAWAQAMTRVGAGKGKHAGMHRDAARQHMEKCRSAIPAWIMPIYRVAETVRPGIDAFDVVIVDEASQSGPEALFLQYLAKKIVVVGDDKQISPEAVGIAREDVELLRQRNITDIPHSDSLGVDSSFFTQAQIRYGGQIRLREHFRCMPEIIQFSNNLCYTSEPLIPLRQFGGGRLEPVRTSYVADGFQKGSSPRVTNPVEAEAIVSAIETCCNSSEYSRKTIGVISLLGADQAKLIERLLLQRIGPEEIERRQLICGDAYTFQGDERDVIFLSLVSAPGENRRIGVLASEKDKRRFNVAASRARDQMWLFHSASLNDLSPACLRHRLLEYCLNPHVESSGVENLSLFDLEQVARDSNRSLTKPPAPFDSWFELDVFLRISRRGYRVVPQYSIAGYFIDLMVEGMKGRLAVECHGDHWHGPERYEQDASRQRMLERCGLRFWTVWGSAFERDPESALNNLWTTLEKLGIRPHADEKIEPGIPSESPKDSASPVRSPLTARPSSMRSRREIDDPDDDGPESNVELELDDDEQTSGVRWSDSGSRSHDDRTQLQEANSVETDSVRLPDPRVSSLDELIPGLVAIIRSEGPMICYRAYQAYARAAGIGRIGKQIRSVFNRAVKKAQRQGFIEEENEHEKRDQISQIVRTKGTPKVIVRPRGDRLFAEIPPSEVAAVMKSTLEQIGSIDESALLRAVLKHYEITHMSQQIHEYLLRVKRRYFPTNN